MLAHAEITHINEAINRAGRQRMLSQRMAKAWLAVGQGVEVSRAERVLKDSIALFDRQLGELKAYAPTPQILATYAAMDATWADYKRSLMLGPPQRARAEDVIALDAKVLRLAHQGAQQLESCSGRNLGKLVSLSGRQRMLSQRAAKFYLSRSWGVQIADQMAELNQARKDFADALHVLDNAPEATPAIRDEIELARQQWIFFDNALTKAEQGSKSPMHAQEVFASSENILQIMDRLTSLFTRLT